VPNRGVVWVWCTILRFYLLGFICVMTNIIVGVDAVAHNNCGYD
jgi:hypothetical protein